MLAAQAAGNATLEDVAALRESISRMDADAHDPELFREEARSTMDRSLAAALRNWERKAPDELKEPVAWIDSSH